jgi:hypothetical protein
VAAMPIPFKTKCHAYVPKKTMQKQVKGDIADIFAAPNGQMAQIRLCPASSVFLLVLITIVFLSLFSLVAKLLVFLSA